jgi:hypothetical protein
MISGTIQEVTARDFIVGIVTPIDLLTYITNTENAEKVMKHQNGSMHRSDRE